MAALLALVAALASASPVSPSPLPSPTPQITWQSVTLGEPVAAVVERMGEPLSRRRAVMGTYVLEYKALGGAATLSLTDRAGRIMGIRLVAADTADLRAPVVDPFGVALGDAGDRLTGLRGLPQRYDDEGGGDFTSYYGKPSDVRWAYGLRDNRIVSIGVIAPYSVVRATGAVVSVPTPRPPDAPTPPPPDARTMETAVKVTPQGLAADPQFEYTYVGAVACGAGDRWSPVTETVFNAQRRNFSRVDAVCPSTGAKRSFYFDITAVFGRGDR